MNGLRYFFDLGNTRAKLWAVCDGVVVRHWVGVHGGDPAALLPALPDAWRELPAGVFGISVLGPEADVRFASAVQRAWGRVPAYASSGARFGDLSNAYRHEPERLGVDRWLALIAGAGECDGLCVVGCGTAITMDVLVGNEHRGGYILPGLALMESALLSGTRKVRFEEPVTGTLALGDSTALAVRNGALSAVVALVERVVRDHGLERVILTGGDAEAVAACLAVPAKVVPELLLRGMMRYFEDWNGSHDAGTPQEVGG